MLIITRDHSHKKCNFNLSFTITIILFNLLHWLNIQADWMFQMFYLLLTDTVGYGGKKCQVETNKKTFILNMNTLLLPLANGSEWLNSKRALSTYSIWYPERFISLWVASSKCSWVTEFSSAHQIPSALFLAPQWFWIRRVGLEGGPWWDGEGPRGDEEVICAETERLCTVS